MANKNECDHAWETVDRCFGCGAERGAFDVHRRPTAPILDDEFRGCPSSRLAELDSLAARLAGCEWRGIDETLKGLIFEARKLSGWKRTQWTK